jgi:prepilin signal peptidase PulO-like enzyme (type II secretory pathway)
VFVPQLVHDRPATFLLALMCLVSGLAVVLGHQVWSGGIAPVLVTLVGWLLLLRGLVLLFLPPNLLESVADALVGAGWLYLAGAVALGLGLILTYAGFRAAPIVPGDQ